MWQPITSKDVFFKIKHTAHPGGQRGAGTQERRSKERHGGRRGVSGFVMSSSDEWEPTDREVTMDNSSTVQPRRSARVRQDVSYTTEKTDDFAGAPSKFCWCACCGMTTFARVILVCR